MFVKKFSALIRDDLFGIASTNQNGFKGFDQQKTRFIFQRNHPCVFGKHINGHPQVAVAIVELLHRLPYWPIHLLLFLNTVYDHLVSSKSTTNGFMESVCILFHQPFFDLIMAYLKCSFFFHICAQSIDTAKSSRAFWIVIDAC